MSLYPEGSSVSQEAFDLLVPASVVHVHKKSDFPPVIGGKINLEDKTYFIMDNINIGSDNFVIPDGGVMTNTNIVSGGGFARYNIVYEGSGTMYENALGITFFRIEKVTHVCTGGGKLSTPRHLHRHSHFRKFHLFNHCLLDSLPDLERGR